ncbi:MAG: carboxypeptidase regulatory-like domain-containing protein [Lachnospiraceae bacterium]|nr:carboxypeptidase regulatory-like domain-containing protein [Lachnospiraceae bacterium]
MTRKGDGENKTAKDKMHKDRFRITIVGVLIYSLALITVMVLSYTGVKAIFDNHDKKVAAEQEAAKAEESPVPEEPGNREEDALQEEPEEEPVKDHALDVDELMDPETGVVDYSVTRFTPGKRSTKLRWKDTVFSRIENVSDGAKAPVNTFGFRRVSAKLPDNNEAEYKVYVNPDTDAVEKITETAQNGNSVEVYDYYFDDGNINYVDGYRTYVDKPVDISSSDIESRYYFDRDCLVRYIYCSEGKATEYNIADIDTYSKGTVDQYDYLESEMINRAYTVYNVAPSLKETELLYGYVMDEFSMPMEDAAITVRSEEDDRVIAETTTDGDGYYKIAVDCTMMRHIVSRQRSTPLYLLMCALSLHGSGPESMRLSPSIWDMRTTRPSIPFSLP